MHQVLVHKTASNINFRAFGSKAQFGTQPIYTGTVASCRVSHLTHNLPKADHVSVWEEGSSCHEGGCNQGASCQAPGHSQLTQHLPLHAHVVRISQVLSITICCARVQAQRGGGGGLQGCQSRGWGGEGMQEQRAKQREREKHTRLLFCPSDLTWWLFSEYL